MKKTDIKRLALIMTVNCVRNTVIEDYHSQGKLTQEEMMAFNKDVANKIYTFLEYLFTKSPEDQQAFLSAMSINYPTNWDQPKLDPKFTKAVKLVKEKRNPFNQIFR
jgi:hypothetical protein